MVKSGIGKKREGNGGGGLLGTACTGRCKRATAVRPGSVAGGGCYGDMEFGMSLRMKPKKNMCTFRMKEIGHSLDGPPKGIKGSYVMF